MPPSISYSSGTDAHWTHAFRLRRQASPTSSSSSFTLVEVRARLPTTRSTAPVWKSCCVGWRQSARSSYRRSLRRGPRLTCPIPLERSGSRRCSTRAGSTRLPISTNSGSLSAVHQNPEGTSKRKSGAGNQTRKIQLQLMFPAETAPISAGQLAQILRAPLQDEPAGNEPSSTSSERNTVMASSESQRSASEFGRKYERANEQAEVLRRGFEVTRRPRMRWPIFWLHAATSPCRRGRTTQLTDSLDVVSMWPKVMA